MLHNALRSCHPGPCPPCQVALVLPCPSHQNPLTIKCSFSALNSASESSLSPVCDLICGRVKRCGKEGHVCQLPCHYGDCGECDDREVVRCYCGLEEKDVNCGWNVTDEKLCARTIPHETAEGAAGGLSGLEKDATVERWKGRFNCGKPCERLYDCGQHGCTEVSLFSVTNFDWSNFRSPVTHIPLPLNLARFRPHKEICAPVVKPISPASQVHLAHPASPPYRLATNHALDRGHADTVVRKSATLASARHVMKRLHGLAGVEKL